MTNNFNLNEWVGRGEKNLLNERRFDCGLVKEYFDGFLKDHAERLADIMIMMDFFRENDMDDDLREFKNSASHDDTWIEFNKFGEEYGRCVGDYEAKDYVDTFLQPYKEKSNILSDFGLTEGANIDVASIVKSIFGETGVQKESAIEEGDVEEGYNPIEEWTNIIKALIKWSKMEAGPEKDKLLAAIERETFAKAKDRRGFDEFDL